MSCVLFRVLVLDLSVLSSPRTATLPGAPRVAGFSPLVFEFELICASALVFRAVFLLVVLRLCCLSWVPNALCGPSRQVQGVALAVV